MPAKKKPAEPPKERGRPTRYTKAIAEKICEQLSGGMTLRQACMPDDMPHESTVRHWVMNEDEEARPGFVTQYAKARETGYSRMADQILEISDEKSEDVQRDRLRVDTRKWLLSKALPKIYGDKVVNTHEAGDSLTEFLGKIGSAPRLSK